MEGWVEVSDDWLFVAVGNERLLRSAGGKAKLSSGDQERVRTFIKQHQFAVIIYICVEDTPTMVLALSGADRSIELIRC